MNRDSRALSAEEIALFPISFTQTIDIASVRLIRRAHNPFARRKILVRHNKVYWPNCPANFSQESVELQSLLMHELCHIWQYHTARLTALSYLLQPKNWAYKYSFDPAKSFDDYPIEKQADLMQDWYCLNLGAAPQRFAHGSHPPNLLEINAVIPFLWENVLPDGGPDEFPDEESKVSFV